MGPRLGYILSSLLRRVPASGISSRPSSDGSPFRVSPQESQRRQQLLAFLTGSSPPGPLSTTPGPLSASLRNQSPHHNNVSASVAWGWGWGGVRLYGRVGP
eukprot:1055158-Prorocentrum_minimum.AAC.2